MRTIATNFSKSDSVSICNMLTESEKKFKSEVQKFAENFIKPLIYQMDADGRLNQELIAQIKENGLMKIEIPKEYGGLGYSFFHTILATEELSIVDPAVAVFVDVQNTLFNNAINRWGNEGQKRKFLTMLAQGVAGAFSITEKEAGSDASMLSCVAAKTSGGYLLNGEKHWVTNAAEADLFLIFAKITDSNTKIPSNNLTAFIIDKRETQGLSVAKTDEKMGIRASSTCDVCLENVFVTEECILGSQGKGLTVALETLIDGRIGISAQMLGLAQGAFNETVKYSQTRKQFGDFISVFQGVHFPLAQIITEIEATRLMVYNAARLKMSKCTFSELILKSSMVKLYASQVAEKVVSICLDICGGVGYMKGNPIEKFYRDAKIGKIYEGTSNMQLRTIARNYVRINSTRRNKV